jgi:excisionase family DNA binding protein
MQPLFYSTGQVARQLGTTLATIRILCENRVLAAETTPGGHWRVPASEVERLKRDSLPPIPRPLPTESAPPARNGTASRHGHPELLAEPSDEVVSAADQVTITRSLLEKRKIDRELEETEDLVSRSPASAGGRGSGGAPKDRGQAGRAAAPAMGATVDAIRAQFSALQRAARG